MLAIVCSDDTETVLAASMAAQDWCGAAIDAGLMDARLARFWDTFGRYMLLGRACLQTEL